MMTFLFIVLLIIVVAVVVRNISTKKNDTQSQSGGVTPAIKQDELKLDDSFIRTVKVGVEKLEELKSYNDLPTNNISQKKMDAKPLKKKTPEKKTEKNKTSKKSIKKTK